MKTRTDYTCPLELTHDITKGKWKPIILWQLGRNAEPQSLAKLQKDINGISQKMLLEHLQELMEYGMVTKRSFAGYPLKVEYSLAERGQQMLEAITIMQNIGIELMKEDGRTDFLAAKGLL